MPCRPIRRSDLDLRARTRDVQRPPRRPIAAFAAGCALAAVAGAQPGALFPEPFLVEHHLVQVDADGSRFATEPVTDYYGGSWLVSVRPDGSRLILDLARREATEIRRAQGTYWTASFERIGELAARVAASEWRGAAPGGQVEPGAARRVAGSAAPRPELVVQQLAATEARDLARAAASSATPGGSSPPLVHLRVVERQRLEEPDAGIEVWLDPNVRLTAPALAALGSFEEAVGAAAAARVPSSDRGDLRRHLAAARAHAGGALPVRTARALAGRPGAAGLLEDVATRVERLAELPRELVTIPEGLRRVAHPMETAAAFLEADAERDRAMSGDGER